MGRHLVACPHRQKRIGDVSGREPMVLLHLRAQDGYGGAFWFDVEVRATATH